MKVTIKAGDLSNMTDFDMGSLNGLLTVCRKVSFSHMGVHLWIGLKHISILRNTISFEFIDRRFMFDEIIINYDILDGVEILDFTIRFNDSELYMSVVLDV